MVRRGWNAMVWSHISWRPGMQITVKIVNVFDGNLEIDLPNHLALINLFDSETGATVDAEETPNVRHNQNVDHPDQGGHALARSQILQPAARTETCLSECVFAH